jgi:hypothetical protein
MDALIPQSSVRRSDRAEIRRAENFYCEPEWAFVQLTGNPGFIWAIRALHCVDAMRSPFFEI